MIFSLPDSAPVLTQAFLWNCLDQLPDPVVIKHRNHQWLAFNQAFCDLLSLYTDPHQCHSDYDFLSRSSATHLHLANEQVLTTGVAQNRDQILVTTTGTSFSINLQSFCVLDEQGSSYLVNCFRPTSHHHPDAATTSQFSQTANRALIEAIPDLLIRMRRDGTYLNISFDGEYKQTAIAVSEGKTIHDFMPADIVETRMRYVQAALETGELQIYNQELVVNNQTVYEEVRIIPCGEDEVLTMIRDVTQQRQTEVRLQELNEHLETLVETRTAALRKVVTQLQQEIRDRKRVKAQLQEQEEFLRSIYDGIEYQVFVLDVTPDQQFLFAGWNQFSERVMGIPSEAGVGQAIEDVVGVDIAQQLRQNHLRCIEAGTSIRYEERVNFQDQDYWAMTTLTPLKDETGRVHRIIGTAIDITERKHIELSLQASETQLRQQAQALRNTLDKLRQTQMQLIQSEKMSGLGQLVAGVAHEINNPVNFIYGNLKYADDYTHDLLHLITLYQQHYPHPTGEIQAAVEALELDFLMEDLPKLLHSMRVGAERIQKIVASLRTFSRMDEAEMKAVNLAECLDSTLMILQNRLKAKPDRPKIEIIQDYETLPPIECYAGQLNQVFMNILSNAIDALEDKLALTSAHSSEDEPYIPQITLRLMQPCPDRVQITIADNGCGIPAPIAQRIFDPFFTTKAIGKGTGMGLSISYQIVTEKHGGSLSCHSTPKTGTEFMIDIPTRQIITPHSPISTG